MRIALCDDEEAEVVRLHDLIENYALKKDYQIHIECFTSGKMLVERDRFDPLAISHLPLAPTSSCRS